MRFANRSGSTGLDEGLRRDGLTTSEHAKLNRPRRENRILERKHRPKFQDNGATRIQSSTSDQHTFGGGGGASRAALR